MSKMFFVWSKQNGDLVRLMSFGPRPWDMPVVFSSGPWVLHHVVTTGWQYHSNVSWHSILDPHSKLLSISHTGFSRDLPKRNVLNNACLISSFKKTINSWKKEQCSLFTSKWRPKKPTKGLTLKGSYADVYHWMKSTYEENVFARQWN